MSRIDIKSIKLMRAEGPNYLFGKNDDGSIALPTKIVDTFEEAGRVLSQDWAKTSCGQDKVDFMIEFSDGEKYKGYYELKRHMEETKYSFLDDFLTKVKMYSGLERPNSIDEKSWEKLVSSWEDKKITSSYKELISKYNIPDTEELLEKINEEKRELKI